jgi:hypothetical protein
MYAMPLLYHTCPLVGSIIASITCPLVGSIIASNMCLPGGFHNIQVCALADGYHNNRPGSRYMSCMYVCGWHCGIGYVNVFKFLKFLRGMYLDSF